MSTPGTPKRLIDERPESSAGKLLARSLVRLPADASAQGRVWRGITSGIGERSRRAPPWRAPVLVIATLVTVVLAGAWWRSGPAPTALLELTSGEVITSMPEGPWTNAEAGGLLNADARLKTGPRATAVVRLDSSAVALSNEGELAFESVGESTRLRLSSGTVTANVEPRKSGRTFVVETSRYRVTVKGTVFSVHQRTPDDVVVSVSRGRVEVSGPRGAMEVPAGREWHSLNPSETVPGEAPRREQSLLEGALRRGPRGAVRVEGPVELISEGGLAFGPPPLTWRAPEGLHRLVGASAAITQALDLEAAEGQVHTATFSPSRPGVTVGRDPPRQPELTEPTEPPGGVRPVAKKVRHLETRSTRQTPARSKPSSEPEQPSEEEPRAPFESAVLLAREGRYEEAAELFAVIAAGKGPHAELALYGLGRLQQTDLRRPREALVTFDRYQRTYPQGTMIQEVEISTIEIQLQRRDFDSALASMSHFLTRHPASERVGEVRLLRGNVRRERGDCPAALEDYALARTGAQESEALYFTGWCQQRLGQTEQARQTWREYLARFPSARHAADAKAALGGAANRPSP